MQSHILEAHAKNQVATLELIQTELGYSSYQILEVLYDTLLASIWHHHVPNQTTIEFLDKNRQENWDIISFDTGNELENHLRSFGYVDDNGEVQISDASIYTAMIKDFKMSPKEAETGANVGISVAKLNNVGHIEFGLSGIKGYFSPKDAIKLMHPSDTGFYKQWQGKFILDRFDKLKPYAVKIEDGSLLISENKLIECINELAKEDHRWDRADFVYKALGKFGHDGEFKQLFSLIEKLGFKLINNEPHYALDDIQQYYMKTASVMKKIRNNHMTFSALPLPEIEKFKPVKMGFFDKLLHSASTYCASVVKETPHYSVDNGVQRARSNQGFLPYSLFANQETNVCSANSTKQVDAGANPLQLKPV